MSKEEFENHGVNTSIIHVDFMIGTNDLEITGITEDKDSFEIFANGNWAF